MNRTDLYRILPHPEEIGQSEYWAIHNLLVDAVNEWASTDSEDVSLFATTLLEEVAGWSMALSNLIRDNSPTVAS